MSMSQRKLIGVLALGVYLIAYVTVASWLGARMALANDWLQLVFYVVAGIIWVLPLKPLFGWMNRPDVIPADDAAHRQNATE